ncbi:helix-turn-helix domain-containing protein [Streptomyces sp. NPDC004227]
MILTLGFAVSAKFSVTVCPSSTVTPETVLEPYPNLLAGPRADVNEVSAAAELSRARTVRALARLAARGMVSRLPGRPIRYLAVPPDAAIGELIGAAESGLRQARDAAQRLMETHRAAARYIHPEESLEVLVGRDAIGRRVAHMEDSAGIQVRGFDKPPYVSPPGGNLDEERRRLRQGIQYRVIYTRDAVAWPGRLQGDIHAALRQGEQARVRPDLPLKMLLADDRMALIPISAIEHDVGVAYVVHPSSLLDALITLFEAEWERGMTLSVEGLADDEHGPDAPALDLLTLLASGLTDESIARSLGWSTRTTQRRIHVLMNQLGATTRFQLGMSAQARGWI